MNSWTIENEYVCVSAHFVTTLFYSCMNVYPCIAKRQTHIN